MILPSTAHRSVCPLNFRTALKFPIACFGIFIRSGEANSLSSTGAQKSVRKRRMLTRTSPAPQSIYEGRRAIYEERSDLPPDMTPAQYGRGGAGATIHYTSVRSPLGRMLLAATECGLCSVQFGETDEVLYRQLAAGYPQAKLLPAATPLPPHLALWIEALHRYLDGNETSLALPLDVRATAFELRVWSFLQAIPYGQTRSYSQVAAELGSPKAVRAVASACARNHVALLIPCHRVLRGDGSLGGFRWGLERKQALLTLERRNTEPASSVNDRLSGSSESLELFP